MSLAEKMEAWYSHADAPEFLELMLEAKRIEEQRDTFLAILTLQQTVKELETRIDAVDPEPSLEQRIRDRIMELQAAVPFVPGEGYATGYYFGVLDATADLVDVLDGVV